MSNHFAVPATTQNRCFYEKGGPFLLLKTHTCGITRVCHFVKQKEEPRLAPFALGSMGSVGI